MGTVTRAFVLTLLLTGLAVAGGMSHSNGYAKPVWVKAIGFSARYADGAVQTQWKRYKRDDLRFYKVVKSKTNQSPVYPEDGYVTCLTDSYQTSYRDKNVLPGVWYYRVCVVTKGGDRWVSSVAKVVVGGNKTTAVPTEADFE